MKAIRAVSRGGAGGAEKTGRTETIPFTSITGKRKPLQISHAKSFQRRIVMAKLPAFPETRLEGIARVLGEAATGTQLTEIFKQCRVKAPPEGQFSPFTLLRNRQVVFEVLNFQERSCLIKFHVKGGGC
jgi:hypothetical protein